MNWSPEQVEREMAGLADLVEQIAVRLTAAGPDRWRSLAADRYRARLVDLAGRVRGLARDLDGAAALAAQHAREVAEVGSVLVPGPIPGDPATGVPTWSEAARGGVRPLVAGLQ